MTAPKAKRPAHLPHGRWLGDFPRLSAAEKALVAACARGVPWEPHGWDGKRPEEATPANTIRAGLIRFLLLGGDFEHPVHEVGVRLRGAWISDVLNIDYVIASVQIDAMKCHFNHDITLRQAILPKVSLSGCYCKSIKADRSRIAGSVFLRNGFTSIGVVRFLGSRIEGSLSLNGGSVENENGISLDLGRLALDGSLLLRDGFSSIGEIRLIGAKVGGAINCNGGNFKNINGTALNLNRTTISGSLVVNNSKIIGSLNLTAASAKSIIDGENINCWESGGHKFDGFRYERIGGTPNSVSRIRWLKLQNSDHLLGEFKPQPWEQLINVLREMGHLTEASAVAIAKQEQMREAGVIKGPLRRPLHWLYGLLAGYGHRPLRTLGAMAMVWLACSATFYAGRNVGLMGPSDPLIHASPKWDHCGAPGENDQTAKPKPKPKPYWAGEKCTLPSEYTTLQPALYSLDLILPLVDLQQETDWSPIVANEAGEQLWWGHLLRATMWFEILFGWAMSLMLVAVLGRLVDKD